MEHVMQLHQSSTDILKTIHIAYFHFIECWIYLAHIIDHSCQLLFLWLIHWATILS